MSPPKANGSAVKITALQIENVKRVQAFALEPAANGLTIIGGNNKNGKTSVLDALAWALGGKKYEPSNPQRKGAMNPPKISVTLNNGLVIERKGKNATLTVTDPTGKHGGQQLLDEFVSQFALDLPRFLNASTRDKAECLLKILGIGDQLSAMDRELSTAEVQRQHFFSEKEAKLKYAQELPEFPDAPPEPVSVSELIQQQQAVLARNGENQRKRENKARLERDLAHIKDQINDLETKLTQLKEHGATLAIDLLTAAKSTEQLQDESTAELERQLQDIESINAQVAANQAKARAQDEAEEYKTRYDEMTERIAFLRKNRMALLDGASLPLPGLSVQGQEIQFDGQPWDGMSGSEQLRVATAIVRQLKPECGFVLMDKLEQFDLNTLREFCTWLESEKLQAIATRVSTGAECTIVIEDGLPAGKTYIETINPIPEAAEPVTVEPANAWGEW